MAERENVHLSNERLAAYKIVLDDLSCSVESFCYDSDIQSFIEIMLHKVEELKQELKIRDKMNHHKARTYSHWTEGLNDMMKGK